MENKEDAKTNILKGVNQKIKRRGIKIAILSSIICIIMVIITGTIVWVNQIPIEADQFENVQVKYEKGSGEPVKVDEFNNVHVEIRMETINEIDNRELPYNHLYIPIKESLVFSLEKNGHFYHENNNDGTATLYFYMSENLIQKAYSGTTYVNVLVTPRLCNTDTLINEITKVYYLVYDYNNLKQEDFNKVKSKAVLLWEK